MSEDRRTTITVPTEWERKQPIYEIAALGITIIVVKWLANFDLQWWVLPAIPLVGLWVLTGEPATDVPVLGAVSSGLRAKFGMRRVDEWSLAWAHYFLVRIWPEWRKRWQQSRLRSMMDPTLTRLQNLRRASGAMLSSRRLRFWSKS